MKYNAKGETPAQAASYAIRHNVSKFEFLRSWPEKDKAAASRAYDKCAKAKAGKSLKPVSLRKI
jgi:hypothetical protein